MIGSTFGIRAAVVNGGDERVSIVQLHLNVFAAQSVVLYPGNLACKRAFPRRHFSPAHTPSANIVAVFGPAVERCLSFSPVPTIVSWRWWRVCHVPDQIICHAGRSRSRTTLDSKAIDEPDSIVQSYAGPVVHRVASVAPFRGLAYSVEAASRSTFAAFGARAPRPIAAVRGRKRLPTAVDQTDQDNDQKDEQGDDWIHILVSNKHKKEILRGSYVRKPPGVMFSLTDVGALCLQWLKPPPAIDTKKLEPDRPVGDCSCKCIQILLALG